MIREGTYIFQSFQNVDHIDAKSTVEFSRVLKNPLTSCSSSPSFWNIFSKWDPFGPRLLLFIYFSMVLLKAFLAVELLAHLRSGPNRMQVLPDGTLMQVDLNRTQQLRSIGFPHELFDHWNKTHQLRFRQDGGLPLPNVAPTWNQGRRASGLREN